VVVIDFESYFDDDFKMAGKGDGLSTIEYVTHHDYETLGVSVFDTCGENFPDYENKTQFIYSEERIVSHFRHLQSKYGEDFAGCTIVAQNARFDLTVLLKRYGIKPRYHIDTLALARAWNSRCNNDLEAITKRLGLPAKGDTGEFRGLTFRSRFKKPKGRKKGPKLPVQVPLITPEQIEKLATYANNDAMREWEAFTILLPRLSRPELELWLHQHTIELFLCPTLEVDYAKGDELCKLMESEIEKAISATGLTRDDLSGNISFEKEMVQALTEAADDPSAYFKEGKKGKLLAIAKDDNERKFLEGHASERVRLLMAGREAIKSWPLHIARVQRIMRMARCNGGKLPVPLKSHGAHTGRDSGGEKINLQNLGNRGHKLVNAVREMIIAPPGHKLVIVDAAAVEARGLAWIAGQWDLVKKFCDNAEVYCGFASKVLGLPVRKPKKNGILAIEAMHKRHRNLGKVGVLGCGYGMGTARILEYANGQPYYCDIDYAMAEKIRDTYRAENPAITQFWKDIERAFIYTAKYGKPCEMPRGLKFHQTHDCDVVLTLPSNRELHYHKVKLVDDDYGEKIEVYNELEHCWGHVWGGHLTENVVQAFCRDFLMESCFRLEQMGHHTALRVHDELVIVSPEDRAEQCLMDTITEMSRRPLWAQECPLSAEGVVTTRYGGH